MAHEAPVDEIQAEIRKSLRAAMCPVCRCIGTTRLFARPGAESREVVCLRCGTALALETSTRKLVPLRIAKLAGIRPAGKPGEIIPGGEIALDRWLRLAEVDESVLRMTAEEVSVRPRTRFSPPQWKAEFEGGKGSPFAYIGVAALIALLVVPLLLVFEELDLFLAAVVAGTASVVAGASFLIAGKPEEPEGRVTLPLLVAQENERHLMSALEAVLGAAKVKFRLPRERTEYIESITYSCENDSFAVRFMRGADPGNPNLLHLAVEPVTRENRKRLEDLCRMLANMLVELGFHLLPIPANQGGVVTLKR